MSKKEKQPKTKRPRARFVDFLAFTGLAAAAVLLVVGPILQLVLKSTAGAETMRIISLIAQYCLLAAIAIPAYYFVRNKRMGWKIFYAVCLIIYVAGTILGVTIV